MGIVSRDVIINPDDSFEELLLKIIFTRDAPGSPDEYCLGNIKNRLARSTAHILELYIRQRSNPSGLGGEAFGKESQ
jgi:hypothetical protein